MTPREAAIAALKLQRPDALVPHVELEFQIAETLWGPEKRSLRGGDLEGVSAATRQEMLKRNAQNWVDIAERYKWNIITGLHWLSLEDQCQSFEYVREISGETYMLSAFADGTFSIPDGHSMVDHVVWLTERTDEALAAAEAQAQGAIEFAKVAASAGAECFFMCADYCFNDGPFLSPSMFRTFVTPYLTKVVAAIHEAGAYAVKHTDGDIMPILDQLVEARPHALHSIDPQAGVDLKKVKAMIGDKVALCGNVHCGMLHNGTMDQIVEDSKRALRDGMPGGGYFFCSSNTPFIGMPLENYLAMLDVREQYGRYDRRGL
jgi:uroporphyrinogen decarboxylase